MCHVFWHSVEISACIGTSCAGIPPWKHIPTDKFSNKFQHLTKKNLFVAQRFLGRNCWGLQCVMLSHSMEISASFTKLFCWLGKSVQPLPSRHPKRFQNAMFQKRPRQTKANQQRQHLWHQRFLGHNCWLPRCADVRVPRYMSKRTAAREPWPRSRVRVNVPVF